MNKTDWNVSYKEGRKYAPVSEIVLDKIALRGGLALDIGCGEGELMQQLTRRGYKTTGIDLSDYSADITGDFMSYDFGDKKYDLITANLVITFVEDKQKFLDKIKSLLAKEGRVILITPVLYKEHIDKYTQQEKAIAVDWNQLEKLIGNYTLHDTCYGGGYTCKVMIEPVIEK